MQDLTPMFLFDLGRGLRYTHLGKFSSKIDCPNEEVGVKKISEIGVSSVFKMSLVLGAAAGVLVGFILMIVDFTDRRFLEGVVTLFLAPILYGVLGSAVNALMAWIYNFAAARLGGIEITLDE
jgi:hypothetical protein